MPDSANTFATRLDSKLDGLQSDLKSLSDQVLRLTIINEAQNTAALDNKKKIELVEIEVNSLKNITNQATGSLSALKWIITFLGATIFSMVAWAGTSIMENKQNGSIAQAKMIRLESDINELRSAVLQNERNRVGDRNGDRDAQ